MGNFQKLVAKDGHQFDAYIAQPQSPPRGGLVLLQEIFGVNSHIKEVADSYAKEGYLVVAIPTMSRIQNGVELGYTDADIASGFELKMKVDALPGNPVMNDIQAGIDFAAKAGKVGIFGFCWGGLLTWKSAAQLDGLSAAAPYYGGGIPNEANLQPKCPVLAHFGDQDSYIPMDSVEQFMKSHPEVKTEIYHANHGFNCNQRGSYDEISAKLAKERTLAFFKAHIG
jgi:carboxymethylenebutenolidase